jgi:cyclophilin family peptidyl-prolyl cis-trans isomerase
MHMTRFLALMVVTFLLSLTGEMWGQLAPNTPTQLEVTAGSLNAQQSHWSARFTWQDQSTDEDGFALLVQVADSTYDIVAILPANATSYQLPTEFGLGSAFQFAVISFRGDPEVSAAWSYEGGALALFRAPDILTMTGHGGTVGSPLSAQFIQPSRPAAVTAVALVNPPAWLSMNPTNGQLLGTPPSSGNFPVTVRVTYLDGWIQDLIFTLRIRSAPGTPMITTALPVFATLPGQQQRMTLASHITDPDAESAVRVETNLGAFDLILYQNSTPITANNFLSYVDAGDYRDVLFHRSVPGFVLQGGGFKSASHQTWTPSNNRGQILNEPGLRNERGTIAMAKIQDFPNSASNQFFININDNSVNLDSQNGGFTVFGRVAGQGMQVIDAIHALPQATYAVNIEGTAVPFSDVPVNTTSTPPTTMDSQLLVKVLTITPVAPVQYRIAANSQPGVANAVIESGELVIDALQPGITTVSLVATDLDGNSTTEPLTITVEDDFTAWAARENLPPDQNGLLQNPDGDGQNNLLEYAFSLSPTIAQQSVHPALGRTALEPAGEVMTLQFPMRKFARDLRYIVEANSQLTGPWTEVWNSSLGLQHARVSQALDQGASTLVSIRDTSRIGSSTTRFLRLRVEKQP